MIHGPYNITLRKSGLRKMTISLPTLFRFNLHSNNFQIENHWIYRYYSAIWLDAIRISTEKCHSCRFSRTILEPSTKFPHNQIIFTSFGSLDFDCYSYFKTLWRTTPYRLSALWCQVLLWCCGEKLTDILLKAGVVCWADNFIASKYPFGIFCAWLQQ
jgi:hypothetical protein